jgi:hypothetical protein
LVESKFGFDVVDSITLSLHRDINGWDDDQGQHKEAGRDENEFQRSLRETHGITGNAGLCIKNTTKL